MITVKDYFEKKEMLEEGTFDGSMEHYAFVIGITVDKLEKDFIDFMDNSEITLDNMYDDEYERDLDNYLNDLEEFDIRDIVEWGTEIQSFYQGDGIFEVGYEIGVYEDTYYLFRSNRRTDDQGDLVEITESEASIIDSYEKADELFTDVKDYR